MSEAEDLAVIRAALIKELSTPPRAKAAEQAALLAPRSHGGLVPFGKDGVSAQRLLPFLEAIGDLGFVKDVTGEGGVTAVPTDQGRIDMTAPLLRLSRAFSPRAVSTRDPLPTMFWSQPTLTVLNVNTITTDVAATTTATYCKTATVKAYPLNAGLLWVTFDGSTARNTADASGPTGWPMNPGDAQVAPTRNLANIRFRSESGTNRAAILYAAEDS